MIRILVADDSATSRALLVALFAGDAEFSVVGEATNGQQAVEMAQALTPDLITMDVQMPVMDGLEATKQIMARSPRPIIIISSTARDDEIALSLEATRAGALMVLPKPEGPLAPAYAADKRQIISMARALSQVKVVRRHGQSPASHTFGASPMPPSSPRLAGGTVGIRLVAIAASTGGPAAIRTILGELPGSFPAPVLIVQHIAHGFTQGLAHWLDADTPLRVKVAEFGEPADRGTVYVAPDDRHIGCRIDDAGALRIVIDNAPTIGAFRPSASYLFRSVAESLGASALSVILTGMGDDGVAGLRVARNAGGRILAQDEASSVIYGMPREAARAGVVDAVVGIDAMARKITELVS